MTRDADLLFDSFGNRTNIMISDARPSLAFPEVVVLCAWRGNAPGRLRIARMLAAQRSTERDAGA